jgi:hypothetical protein
VEITVNNVMSICVEMYIHLTAASRIAHTAGLCIAQIRFTVTVTWDVSVDFTATRSACALAKRFMLL